MQARYRHLTFGAALVVLTAALAALWLALAGQPFGDWGWSALTFTLLIAEVLALAVVAVASGPFEPRLRRWSTASDPLAIGFQLDLAMTELSPPRRVWIEARWLWLMLPPALGVLLLGVALALPNGSERASVILVDDAVTAAELALVDRMPDPEHRTRLGWEVTTMSDASAHLGDDVPFTVTDPERLVYVVYFTTEEFSKDETTGLIKPGPVAVVDADTGAVLGTGAARYLSEQR